MRMLLNANARSRVADGHVVSAHVAQPAGIHLGGFGDGDELVTQHCIAGKKGPELLARFRQVDLRHEQWCEVVEHAELAAEAPFGRAQHRIQHAAAVHECGILPMGGAIKQTPRPDTQIGIGRTERVSFQADFLPTTQGLGEPHAPAITSLGSRDQPQRLAPGQRFNKASHKTADAGQARRQERAYLHIQREIVAAQPGSRHAIQYRPGLGCCSNCFVDDHSIPLSRPEPGSLA